MVEINLMNDDTVPRNRLQGGHAYLPGTKFPHFPKRSSQKAYTPNADEAYILSGVSNALWGNRLIDFLEYCDN